MGKAGDEQAYLFQAEVCRYALVLTMAFTVPASASEISNRALSELGVGQCELATIYFDDGKPADVTIDWNCVDTVEDSYLLSDEVGPMGPIAHIMKAIRNGTARTKETPSRRP